MFAGFEVLVISSIKLCEVLLAIVRSVQLLDNSTVVSNVLCCLQGLLRQQHAYDDQTPKVVVHKLDLTVAKQTCNAASLASATYAAAACIGPNSLQTSECSSEATSRGRRDPHQATYATTDSTCMSLDF
jgi:hypothetical protein